MSEFYIKFFSDSLSIYGWNTIKILPKQQRILREKVREINSFNDINRVNLKKQGYKAICDCDFIEEVIVKQIHDNEIEEGRYPCVGYDFGCMATTNGSQFCMRTFCPYFNI